MLLKAGADINASSAAGNTPLHSIAKLGDSEVLRWMLEKSADPYKKVFSFPVDSRTQSSCAKNNDGVAPIDNIKSPELLKIVNEASRAKSASTAAAPVPTSSALPTTPKKGGEDSDEEGEGLFTKKNWIKDEEASACMNCSTPFTFMNRRVRSVFDDFVCSATVFFAIVRAIRIAANASRIAPLQSMWQDFLRQVLRQGVPRQGLKEARARLRQLL